MAGIRGRTWTAARARFLLKGQKIGWATEVNVQEVIDARPARVLDKLEAADFPPTAYDVSVDIGTLTIVGESAKKAGYYPAGGRAEGERLKNIIAMDDITLALEDNVTAQPVLQVRGLHLFRQGISINAGNIVGTRISGMGIEVVDPSEL